MYTNGLKDRFGSPLISLDEADERYILQGDIEFQHKKIEEKIYETEKFLILNTCPFPALKTGIWTLSAARRGSVAQRHYCGGPQPFLTL